MPVCQAQEWFLMLLAVLGWLAWTCATGPGFAGRTTEMMNSFLLSLHFLAYCLEELVTPVCVSWAGHSANKGGSLPCVGLSSNAAWYGFPLRGVSLLFSSILWDFRTMDVVQQQSYCSTRSTSASPGAIQLYGSVSHSHTPAFAWCTSQYSISCICYFFSSKFSHGTCVSVHGAKRCEVYSFISFMCFGQLTFIVL